MLVLVVNAGSSSLKVDVLDPATGQRAASWRVERVGTPEATLKADGGPATRVEAADHEAALRRILPSLPPGIAAVGHRVVHGGAAFTAPTLVSPDVETAVEALAPIAPLHVPANLAGLRAARAVLPDLPHVAVFDTAFHATLPRRARAYAIPQELADAHQLRRFGFHGTSHAWIARKAAEHLGQPLDELRIITLHLGNGASAAAVEYGRSVETSMGMSPLEGLVMGTRPGDVDPGVLLHLLRSGTVTLDQLDHLLNEQSGLLGLSGTSDMRDCEQAAADGHEGARLALQVFTHRLRKTIGAYAAAMGGVDAIVFSAGIGENSPTIRERTAQRLDFLGARLDEDRNRDAKVGPFRPVAEISTEHSRCALLVVHSDEAHAIATDALAVARGADRVVAPPEPAPIPIAVSARHVHLTQEAVEALFGPGHQLTPRNPLSQPGQFASEECVDLVGPKRTIERVRVLGPTRKACQVEVSRTDEFFLGLDAPVRASGDTKNSPGITLRGPAGSLTIAEGVICAWRHIHMHPDDAVAYGVSDKDVVDVEVCSGPRRLVFGDVLVRVHPEFALEMHIDTDEANAAELGAGAVGALVSTEGRAELLRKKIRHDATSA